MAACSPVTPVNGKLRLPWCIVRVWTNIKQSSWMVEKVTEYKASPGAKDVKQKVAILIAYGKFAGTLVVPEQISYNESVERSSNNGEGWPPTHHPMMRLRKIRLLPLHAHNSLSGLA